MTRGITTVKKCLIRYAVKFYIDSDLFEACLCCLCIYTKLCTAVIVYESKFYRVSVRIFYIAMLTGVAVNYCNTLIKLRQKDTMARFMDDLEHLEELDRDEFADLSRRVREYRRRQR